MPTTLRLLCASATFIAATLQVCEAASDLPLSAIAHTHGYTYAWLPTEAAATLSRPGVTILVRAGNPRYEVNDAIRYASDTPLYRANEMYVGAMLDRELADLAAAHPWPVVAQAAARSNAESGLLTASASYRSGTQAILVAGRGTPGTSVRITLTGQVSRDLPVVVISRTSVVAAADGSYAALLPAAAVSFKETVLTATVGAAGAAPVTARVTRADPDPAFASPNNTVPAD